MTTTHSTALPPVTICFTCLYLKEAASRHLWIGLKSCNPCLPHLLVDLAYMRGTTQELSY
jgi:hypothetical protein